MRLELLESRALLTSYTYPYGATPDDTGEYMLGDVEVNVVFMQSDANMAPYDIDPTNDPVHPGHGLTPETWTASDIANVKGNIQAGLQWWKDTLVNMFPSAPSNLLNFDINWQYADTPVHTGYEPIARISNDFAGDSLSPTGGQGWIYDFLHQVGFDHSGDFSTDLRSFNDYTRQQAGTDWAFTMFVVNNDNDPDKLFAPGGSFTQAFSYAGGRFMVVPESRPASTFSHETGHQFWALDEYSGGSTYAAQRGYYNTQNLNAADNPAPGFVQQPSIMSNGSSLTTSYNNHQLDPYTMAAIGWRDSDNNGIMDVLDVPFSLQGFGEYNATTHTYDFSGSSHVNTLPNHNSSGTGDDISINQVNVVQASIDGGPWQVVQSFPSRTYQTNVSVSIPVGSSGIHDIDIRTADLRTGVTSSVFHGQTDAPTSAGSGLGGVVFGDLNASASWDSGEPGLFDVGVEVTDLGDQPLNLQHNIEPNDYAQATALNTIEPNATLSAVGAGVQSGVYARTSTFAPLAGNVFTTKDITNATVPTWNSAHQLRVDFASPVSTVSINAWGTASGTTSFGRIDAYDQNHNLVARTTSGAISNAAAHTMTVTHPQGDIAYVIVYGYSGTSVVLDSLVWGPAALATTNSDGVYQLGYLPDGTYHIHVSPPAGYTITTPAAGYATVTVSGGQATGQVNFGISAGSAHPFHNVANPLNVNNDAQNGIFPNDALMVINWINANQAAEGEIAPGQNPNVIGYIDVDDNGFCTPRDALMVINYINAHSPGSGEGEVGGSSAPAAGSSSGGAQGEGEGQVQVPTNPADYYAQQPIHLQNIPGSDDCCTDEVTPAAISAGTPNMPTIAMAAAALRLTAESSGDLEAAAIGGWSSLASAKLASPTVSPILASSSLSGSSLATTASAWSSLALSSRKSPADLLHDGDQLEQTLDDIAPDVAGFQAGDGDDQGRIA